MHGRLTTRDLVIILIVVTLWGFAFVPIKWALAEVPPFMLAALRFVFAAFPAVFFVARPAMAWRLVVAYGIAIGVVQYGLLYLGMQLGMPAGLSSLVMQMQVYFTIGLAVAFAGDRLHRWNIFGALIAFVGVVLLGLAKVSGGMSSTFIGFIVMIVAALGWAVGNLIAKRAAGADMFSLVVWSSVVAPPVLFVVSYATEGGIEAFRSLATASWSTWIVILFLAWGATLFGFSQWNRMLHRYPAALISPFALLVPVSGLASGALLLDERLTTLQAIGVALVFAGLVVNVYGPALWARWRVAAAKN
ncbi:MAG TPA: EamA family transporter [Casimicrobiaceae bacterium]|nr:EamA family transporter [Casimicrobiaceae bacterium]